MTTKVIEKGTKGNFNDSKATVSYMSKAKIIKLNMTSKVNKGLIFINFKPKTLLNPDQRSFVLDLPMIIINLDV